MIARGDHAIRFTAENVGDDEMQAASDLLNLIELDSVVGILASGRTPYVRCWDLTCSGMQFAIRAPYGGDR